MIPYGWQVIMVTFHCSTEVSHLAKALKLRKLLVSPNPRLSVAVARGIPLEFLDETYPAKTRGMGLLYGETCTTLTSTVLD